MARSAEVEAAMSLLLTKWQIKHVAEITRCGSSKKQAVRRLVNLGIAAVTQDKRHD